MNALASLIAQPAAQALAWTLLHFLWQGAAIGLVAYVLLRSHRLAATSRYAIGIGALAMMLAAPVVTFVITFKQPVVSAAALNAAAAREPVNGAATIANPVAASEPTTVTPGARAGQRPVISAVVLTIWLTGVLALSLRLLGGWVVARRLATRAVRPVGPELQALARRVAGRLALDRVVHVFESPAVSVPVMVGWITPVVLLPAAALSGLTPMQIEALLAHELAHVRRHDYLVNLLQSVVETLLFYHPAVWWVSREVRTAREHCCDDLAVGVCDRVVYVSALTDLAALRPPRLVLAATDGSLLHRVRRLLGQETDSEAGRGWLPALVVLLVLGAIAPITVARPAPDPDSQQSTGVVGGVPSGVPGGVVGGVPAGVPGGMVGGVVGGVPGGMVGGVVGGVPAGVPGGVAAADQSAQESARVVEQIQAQAAALEQAKADETKAQEAAMARLLAVQAELDRIEMDRLMLEFTKVQAAHRAQIAMLQNQLETHKRNAERIKQQVEVGMASPTALAEVEGQIREVEQKLASEKVSMEIQEKELALRRREIEQNRERQRLRQEVEQALRRRAGVETPEQVRVREARAALGARAQGREVLREIQPEELRPDTRAVIAEALVAMSVPVTGATARVQAGDIVVVDIQGEPDLPRAYRVQADGSIRLPLIGAVKVVNLDISQLRVAIAKQLTDRKLTSVVTVELRRPR